jgi:hypothetical protein
LINDASGKQVESISAHVEGKLTPERLAQAKNNGYRFSRRLALKPGAYQVRIGVLDESTGRIGTATAWVEVPEPERDRLEISSLILRNPFAVDQKDAAAGDLGRINMVQGIPLYGRDAFCEYSFRIRQNRKASDSELVFKRELLKGGNPVKQEPWLPIFKEEQSADSKGWFEVNDDMDLSRFVPGVYELRVSVKNTHSNKTVERTAVFSVE